jgi:type I restriction enzyme S subunit
VIGATHVVRATDHVIDSFAKLAKPLLARIAIRERESHSLAALRDTLLPALISGELRLEHAERLLPGSR